MNFNSIKYLFTEGLKNLLNNIFMALASIGVLTACLLIVGFSVILKQNVKNAISFMGEQSTVILYLKDEAKPEQIEEISKTYKNNENVKSVDFISKEEALKIYSKMYNNVNALELLRETNVLPASINVHIKNVEKINEIIDISKDSKYSPIIEETASPTSYATTIKELGKTASIFGTVLIIALIIASLVIISNTIRATVFTRRREIVIMKQVGATDSFVQFPFLIEGAAIGIISSAIAFFLTFISYKTIFVMLMNNSSGFLNSIFSTFIRFENIWLVIAFSFLICGTFVGAIGSMISLRRYLKI